MTQNIGETGIEWSNPQVWGSVAPLIQQYAKDYNDRADEHTKLKISLQQQAEKAKQAQALEAQKALVKQQADAEKSMAAFGIKPQNYFQEDIPIISKSMDDLKVAAGQYRMKTGKSPLDSYDPEALKIQADLRNHQLLEAQAAAHADQWNKIDRSNIDPEQDDELLTQRAAYAMSVNPNMTRDEALALQRNPFGYKTVAPLPKLERLDLAKEVTETAKNHIKKTGEEKNLTGTLLTGTKDEVIDAESAANAVLLDWTNSPTKMLDLSTRPEFAKTDSQGNPIHQLDGQGRPVQQKMEVNGEGVKVLPLYEIDENKIMGLIKSLMPTTSLHETKEIKSKPAVTKVIVNNAGDGLSKGDKLNIAQRPLTEGTGFEAEIGKVKVTAGRGKTVSSVAQINSKLKGGQITLGNNTILVQDPNPNNKGATIMLRPFRINKLGDAESLTEAQSKATLDGKTVDLGDEPLVDYLPINTMGVPISRDKKTESDRFMINKGDKQVVGVASFIRVKIDKEIFYIPAGSLEAEHKKILPQSWLFENNYGASNEFQ